MRSQCARISGSRAGRLARIGNAVVGRLRVALKSGPPLLLIGASPSMRAAQTPTRGAALRAVDVTEVETPFFADAPVATAELTIHVVDEGTLLPVLEENPHDAGATRYDRGHHFDHGSDTPLFVRRVLHTITEPQEEPLLSVEQRRHP